MNITAVSGYNIIRKLGQGGMAEVYEAVETKNKQRVALKFLLPHHACDPAARLRFLREAKTGMKLDHPNIVRVLDTGENNGQPFIVMELVKGKTLDTIIKEEKLPLSRIIAIGTKIADALAAAHKLGIVHRDISPRNIILHKDTVKVMDFGLAKVIDTTTLTDDHAILGTFYYMSPEQAVGEAIDCRSDIFSLGVVLYQMLTKRQPFPGDHAGEIIHALLYTEPARICDIDYDLPVEVEQVVFKALQKKADSRYQSAIDLKGDLVTLKDVLAGKTVTLIASDITVEEVFERHRGVYSALIGRDQELQRLQGYMTKMLNGTGSAVFVSGEAGIGKSRLVWELGHQAEKRGVRYLMGRSVSHGGIPYQPMVEVLRHYFAHKGVHDTKALNKYLKNHAKHLRYRKDIVAALVLRQSFKDLRIINKEQLWDTASEIIKMIAKDRPVIMHLDDLHWADAQTLDMLTSIARSSTDTRVLMIGTFRPEDIAETRHPLRMLLKRKETSTLFHEISLKRLDKAGTKNIINSVFENSQFTEKFIESIHRETEGNPLFVLEVLKLLRDENIITRYNGGWRMVREAIEIHIPKTVTEVIRRRIEKLNRDEREVIELAAVEGISFTSDTVIHCLAQPRVAILRGLQNLESSHNLIHATRHGYQFDHGKIKDVIYDSLIPELKKEYHKLIGTYLEEKFGDKDEYAGRIAYHLIITDKENNAIPFLDKAAQHAYQLYANHDALNYVNKCINILETFGKQITTDQQSMLLSMYYLRATLTLRLGSIRDFIDDQKKRIKMARSIGDTKELAFALSAAGNGATMLAQYKDAHRFNQQALRTIKKLPDKTIEAYILTTMAKTHCVQGEYEKAVNLCKKSYTIGRQTKNYTIIFRSLTHMSNAYFWWAHLDDAMKISKRLLTLAQIKKDMKYISYATNTIGSTLLITGEYRKGLNYLKRSKQTGERVGDILFSPNILTNLGDVYLGLGNHDKALSYLKDAQTRTLESGDVWLNRLILTSTTYVYIDIAEYEQALHCILKVCQEKKHDGLNVIHELNYLCILWLEIGAERTAYQTFQKIKKAFNIKKSIFINPDTIFDDTNHMVRIGFKYYLRKNFRAAARNLYKALPSVKKSKRFKSLIHTYLFIIKTDFARKNYQKAEKITKEFLSYAKHTGYKKYIAQGYLFMAQLNFIKKRYTTARKAAMQCKSICKRYALRELHWQAHYLLGRISIKQRQYRKAWKDLTTAQNIIDAITAKLSNPLKKIYLSRREIKDLKKDMNLLKDMNRKAKQ